MSPKAKPQAPQRRSAAGRLLAQNATGDSLVLQQCDSCGAVQYPPREVCAECLANALEWKSQAQGGELLAFSGVQHSLEPFFQKALPWPLASVKLDCGPVALARLSGECSPGARLRVGLHRQPGDSWILQAAPETKTKPKPKPKPK